MRLLFVLSIALLATALWVYAPGRGDQDKPAEKTTPSQVVCVRYREIRASGAKIELAVHRDKGGEAEAFFLGISHLRMAYDPGTYWFWARPYDSRHYYFCGSEDVGKSGVEAFMRPLFVRCASGAEFAWGGRPLSGTVFLSDGGCEVEAEFSEGRPTKQTYRMDGAIALVVEFRSHQNAAGFAFPRRLTLKARDMEPVEVDMGEVEVNPSDGPRTTPPKGMLGTMIQP